MLQDNLIADVVFICVRKMQRMLTGEQRTTVPFALSAAQYVSVTTLSIIDAIMKSQRESTAYQSA